MRHTIKVLPEYNKTNNTRPSKDIAFHELQKKKQETVMYVNIGKKIVTDSETKGCQWGLVDTCWEVPKFRVGKCVDISIIVKL